MMAAVFALLLAFVPASWAQTAEPTPPEQLGKQRKDLYLRATHAPLADLAKDVNQIAVQSETCRVKYGSAACGLSDKALESDKLEDRYDYYVKQPVEVHAKPHSVKVNRGNWTGSDAPAHP
jgi:hypothetical protein